MRTTSLLALLLAGVACLAGCGSTSSSTSTDTGGAPLAPVTGPLVVVDRSGTSHDLQASLRAGRPVALVFWQSWCKSCLEEAPGLAAAARELDGRMEFVGVVPGPDASVDETALDAAIARFELPYPQVRDRDLSLTQRFGIEGTPTIVVLGSGGQVVYRGHRAPEDWSALLP